MLQLRTADSGADQANEINLKQDMSRRSARQHSNTLPIVQHKRGLSSDAKNFGFSPSKNSATLKLAALQTFKGTGYEEESGQPNMSNNQRYLAQIKNYRNMQGGNFRQTHNAAPSNYELAALKNGFDPMHEATLKDFKVKNIGDLKTFKTSRIAHSKEQIEMIHGHLRHE